MTGETAYVRCVSDKFPSHYPPQSKADKKAHEIWKSEMTEKQRTRYTKHVDEAMRAAHKNYMSLAPYDKPPDVPSGFRTDRISDWHCWPYYENPIGDTEFAQQVRTCSNIYSLRNRAERDHFYNAFSENVRAWTERQTKKAESTKQATGSRGTAGTIGPNSAEEDAWADKVESVRPESQRPPLSDFEPAELTGKPW